MRYMKFKTRNIFKNRKTKFAVDFGVCSFMALNENGNYQSESCPGCYSARILNVYPALRRKLEEIDGGYPDMDDFIADITKIAATGLRYIRFYSLGDFLNEKEIPYIHAAAEILPVEIFSKTLHSNFRDLLPVVAAHPNVNISLSLNSTWDDEYIEVLQSYIIEQEMGRNVQLNYCFMGKESMRWVPYISVYHTTKTNKLELFEFFGYNRVCCARDDDGVRVKDKNSGNHKGSCLKCPLCKLPVADKDNNILTPKLLKETYASQV